METVLRSHQLTSPGDGGQPFDGGAGVGQAETECRRIADAADAALGQALERTDIQQFMRTFEQIGGGQ